jgi:DNA-directed RNA polymerase specialized sigma24 family protein
VERLRPPLCEALLLRYLEQLSADEAADVAGISQAAYKQRLVRALRQLRVLLHAEKETRSVPVLPGEAGRACGPNRLNP